MLLGRLWGVSLALGQDLLHPLPPAVPCAGEEAGGAFGTCLPHQGASLAPSSPRMVSRLGPALDPRLTASPQCKRGVVLAPGSELTPGGPAAWPRLPVAP